MNDNQKLSMPSCSFDWRCILDWFGYNRISPYKSRPWNLNLNQRYEKSSPRMSAKTSLEKNAFENLSLGPRLPYQAAKIDSLINKLKQTKNRGIYMCTIPSTLLPLMSVAWTRLPIKATKSCCGAHPLDAFQVVTCLKDPQNFLNGLLKGRVSVQDPTCLWDIHPFHK